jgi:hypothetical protein
MPLESVPIFYVCIVVSEVVETLRLLMHGAEIGCAVRSLKGVRICIVVLIVL